MKKKAILLILGMLLVILVGIIFIPKIIYDSKFKAGFNLPANREEAWIQDLSYFQKNYYTVCKSFPKDSVGKANQIIDSVKQNINTLSNDEIKLALSHCVSMANDAHTAVYFGNFRRVPLRFYLFDDGLFVIKAQKGFEKYLGWKITRICDKPVDELIRIVDYYKAGNRSWIENECPYFLSSPDFFTAAGLSPTSDSIKYEFANADSVLTEYFSATGGKSASGEYDSWQDLIPANTAEWLHILDGKTLPAYLAFSENGYKVEYFPQLKTLYLQINTSGNFPELGKEIDNYFNTEDVRNAIVDLRLNSGGDYTKLTRISKTLPKKIKEKVFIITGKATFSAGICTAVRLKYFAKGKAVVVGQPVGDNLQFWAEGRQFQLPNSKITIRAATKYHDWENNRFNPFKTNWANLLYGVDVESLLLDIPVNFTYKDYCNGIDRNMIEIESVIKNE